MLITLRDDVGDAARQFLRQPIEGVRVLENAPESVAIARGKAMPIEPDVVDRDEVPDLLDGRSPKTRLALIRAVLDDETAARLEDAGIAFLDPTGRRWMPGTRRTRRSQVARPRSSRRALRAPSLRLSQLLTDHPDEYWTERHLSERGGTTQVTAHRLLVRLEEMALVERHGQGRGASRRVGDIEGMRRWLAREGRPSRGTRLSCYVPEPESLPETVAGLQLVLTGAAAAERIGMPVLTGVAATSFVRVAATGEELEGVPEALGGFRAESGANMVLLADPDRLASADASRLPSGSLVAPRSRIMLDLYLEPRGAAAADVFLDLWRGR